MRPWQKLAALAVLSAALATPLAARQRPTPQPISFNATDSAAVASLAANGRRVEGARVVLWAPRDSMTGTHQAALADTLDRGVAELERLMRGPLPWQRHQERKVTYYLVPGGIISHARAAVFISIGRALTGRAPYLHETSHVLLFPKDAFLPFEVADSARRAQAETVFPLWLSEGLADVLALTAAPRAGVREGDVQAVGGLDKADSSCAARLRASEYRSEVERVVGATGRVEALFTTDRTKVAPTFYACAQSMTKFVVDRIGLDRAIALFPLVPTQDWMAVLERDVGMPLSELQAAWRARLGLP